MITPLGTVPLLPEASLACTSQSIAPVGGTFTTKTVCQIALVDVPEKNTMEVEPE